jgi:hypothetical protein
MRKSSLRAFVPALVLLAGCASTPVGRGDLLDFITDGRTRREELLHKFGEPSASYENARIVAYRLRRDEGGYVLSRWRENWAGVHYSMVLVFDSDGLLQRHALVTVNPP